MLAYSKSTIINPVLSIVGTGLVTMITLAGPLWAVFAYALIETLIAGHNLFVQISIGILLLLGIQFGSGALWGVALAVIHQKRIKPLAKAGAFSWAISTILITLILDSVNNFHFELSERLGTTRHFIFSSAFTIAIVFVVFWCVYRVFPHLSASSKRREIALVSAVFAALAYLAVDRYMVSQGWVLGRPQINGASVMITVMLNGISFSALVGGGVLGLFLPDPEDQEIS